MNILHVSQNYFPSKGGPQYTMRHVSEKLVSYYGDTVEVCTTNSLYGPEATLFEKIEPAIETIENVQVNRLPFNRWHYPLITLAGKIHGKLTGKPLPDSISQYRWQLDSPAIDKRMSTAVVDVIMATTSLYRFADYPMWRSKTKNPKPFVLYGAVHLHEELEASSPLLKRAKACDCYIANTEFERQELIKYGVEERKIVTVGTGIEPADFECGESEIAAFKKQNGITEDDVVIGFIGRLVKGKGVAILLDAFRKLWAENKNLKLLLAGGTTEYVPQIKKIVAAEGLPVILIENFDEKVKPLIYHSLDVFVLPSQSESFGVVFLEAWVCRKPVIGTRMGAIASLLSDGKDSLLFSPSDVNDLSYKVKLLIDKRELRHEFASAGYEKVKRHYTWNSIVSKYRGSYLLGIENFNRQYR